MGNQIITADPATIVNSGPGVCPVCEHDDPGTAEIVSKVLRWVFRMRPPRLECPADDGMGGGFEHDGRCGCLDDFHA